MNKLRLIALTSAGLLVSTGAFLVACGDDTSIDPGADGGGSETSTTEAGKPDGGEADAKPDAFDSGFVVATFPKDIGSALCGSLARCCFGNANLPEAGAVDGGTFDRGSCETFYGQFGLEGSNLGHDLLDAGNIELDHGKAADCVAKVKALSCDLSAADFQAARDACYGALRGKLNTGACKGNIECAPGFFCKTAIGNDSGVGSCTAIRPLGGNCGDFTDDPGAADPACSWRGGGDTKRYCQFDDNNDPTEFRDAGDWKCADGLPNGSGCYLSTWCADGICDESTGECKTPSSYFANSCAKYILP